MVAVHHRKVQVIDFYQIVLTKTTNLNLLAERARHYTHVLLARKPGSPNEATRMLFTKLSILDFLIYLCILK